MRTCPINRQYRNCPTFRPIYGFSDTNQDELLWGAAWLHKASRRREYREYIMRNEVALHAGDTINEFGWDNKHAGINVLISKVSDLYDSNVKKTFIIIYYKIGKS